MPLQARSGITTDDFYEYWLNAHVTPPARFPGISSIFLHSTSFDDATWPQLPGVSRCITTKYRGVITLAGVRGVAVTGVIRRLGATSQLDDEVSALFMPEPVTVLV
jgi:hypothetical protein